MLSLAAFESCRLRTEHLYHIYWLGYSLTLGAVLIYLSLSPPNGQASNPHGASVDASYVAEMSYFVYRVYASFT